jgi:ADP-ribose pyrophosphatase
MAMDISGSDIPGLSVVQIDRGGTILLFPASAVVLAFRSDGKIALVRQYRPAVARSTLELPGGRVERGETPGRAARREFLEETGLRCNRIERIITLDLDFSVSRHQTHVYTGKIDTAEKASGAFEVVFLSPARALRLTERGEISHAPTVVGLYWWNIRKSA